MQLKKWFLTLLLVCSPANAYGQMTIASAARAKAPTSQASWWACATTIGQHSDIPQLKQLLTQAGHIPVTEQTILQAAKDFKFAFQGNPHRNSQEGLNWITRNLEAGRPVIVGVQDTTVRSSYVVVTYISRAKEDFDNDRGFKANDFVVDFVDPADQGNYRYALGSFTKVWTGAAYAFEQDPQAAQPPPIPVPVGPVIGPPPIQPVKISSNQDIKDGIRRPADTLEYGLYGTQYGHHDYYSEFRGRKP